MLLDTILSVLGRGLILGSRGDGQAKPATLGAREQLVGACLLLVEDNDINREFASELLRSEGIEVDEAVNGQEAIEKVRRRDYDAVLMDIQMPVMNGLEAARSIRGLAQTPGFERFGALPIIAMSALAMEQDAEKSRIAGMNDHVTKPVDPDHLMAVLAKWVHPPTQRKCAQISATPGSDLPPELLALSSLDAREGVRRIGGNVQSYRRQLRRFREHYVNAAGELQRLVADQDLRQAEDYCHMLKGVVGNIEAQALYRKVAEIDVILKQGKPPPEERLEELHLLLNEVMRDIDTLAAKIRLETPSVDAALTAGQLRERLESLKEALNYDLGRAEPLLADLLAGANGTPLESEISAIAAKVDIFDIDAAQSLLAHLIDTTNRLPE